MSIVPARQAVVVREAPRRRRRYPTVTYRGTRRVHRRRAKQKVPLATALGVAGMILGGSMGGSISVLEYIQAGNITGIVQQTLKNVTGYDYVNGTWNFSNTNWLPAIAGVAVSATLGRFVNRRLRIPYVKL